MTKNKDSNNESLAEIVVDPDILARELALEKAEVSIKMLHAVS